VRFRAFFEPDLDNRLTAAATEPLRGAQRRVFRDCRPLTGDGG
jgi:hypothetical protein